MNDWLKQHLVCPRDHHRVQLEGTRVICPVGHTYPRINGIPVMLLEEVRPTHGECSKSIKQAKQLLPISSQARESHRDFVDPFVQKEIAATNGLMYQHLLNKLGRYPIPHLRLPNGEGRCLLDIGCNWGRWCIAATRKGYDVVGIDPSLDAILAAQRVANQLSLSIDYLVADARYLPFLDQAFDAVFSYSVFQHFDKGDVELSLTEMARALKPLGAVLVQMADSFGLRNFFSQLKRGFREARGFEVRYWRPSELLSTFRRFIGPTDLSVDGFFSLNAQASDMDLLPLRCQLVVRSSELLRRWSGKSSWLIYLADSLYVKSVKE